MVDRVVLLVLPGYAEDPEVMAGKEDVDASSISRLTELHSSYRIAEQHERLDRTVLQDAEKEQRHSINYALA